MWRGVGVGERKEKKKEEGEGEEERENGEWKPVFWVDVRIGEDWCKGCGHVSCEECGWDWVVLVDDGEEDSGDEKEGMEGEGVGRGK